MGTLSRSLSVLFNELFPSPCLSCGYVHAREPPYLLCPDCAGKLLRVAPGPRCLYCGRPLLSEFDTCLDCRADPPPFRNLHAIWWYDQAGMDLLRAVKFDGDRGVFAFFSQALQAALDARFEPARTVLVPMPPHPASRSKRGFDLMERVLSGVTGYRTLSLLGRKKGGHAQKDLDRRSRQDNLLSQLYLKNGAPGEIARLQEARIEVLMVDDLFTTGATLRAAGEMLCKAGLVEPGAVVLFRD